MLTIGALFAGYGGLELGLSQVIDVNLAWYAEVDPSAAKIMAHHHPGVPNLGDVTKIDWSTIPRVDIITGGSPCQDLSTAGKRAGMTAGTRSNLWAEMRDAIATIRPALVVWENVHGALSAEASSAMEPCPGCVGDRNGRPVLRALGRVLGDLAELRMDARWYGLRAADVGAPHGRKRIFLFATPADSDHPGWLRHGGELASGAEQPPTECPGDTALTLLPTPVADNSRGLPSSGTDYASLANTVAALLPTPRATDGTHGSPNQRGSSGDLMLPSAIALLPTPSAADGMGGHLHQRQGWGVYEPAIRRWEVILGRPTPSPTKIGPKGKPRLNPALVEHMMGLPHGWITNPAIGISDNAQLKAGGNGVVPQQVAAAFRAYLTDEHARYDQKEETAPAGNRGLTRSDTTGRG